jgi:hypothetical protein
MARNTATSQRITGTFGAGLAYPSTYFVRAKSADLTNARWPFGLANAAAGDDAFFLGFRGDAGGDPVQLRIGAGGAVVAVNSAAAYSANTWTSICGRATTTTDYDIFRDGVKTDNSGGTAGTPTNVTQFVIGAYVSLSVYQQYLNNDVSSVAAWSAALTDDEIASLSKGFSPRRVRPQNLVIYAPLVREVIDILRNGIALTDSGSSVAVHPRSYGM